MPKLTGKEYGYQFIGDKSNGVFIKQNNEIWFKNLFIRAIDQNLSQ